jgi:hypothetical protein
VPAHERLRVGRRGPAATARAMWDNGANLGFEAQSFLASDKLRKNL